MASKACRSPATMEQVLTCLRTHCSRCDQPLSVAYRTRAEPLPRCREVVGSPCVFAVVAIKSASGIIGPIGQKRRGNGPCPMVSSVMSVLALVGALRYTSRPLHS
jgi:hypothetical protein